MIKNALNIILVSISFSLFWFLYTIQNDLIRMKDLQMPLLFGILISSFFLAWINHKNQKNAVSHRWWWILFEIVGIVGLLYSGFILTILLMFRNCCGF